MKSWSSIPDERWVRLQPGLVQDVLNAFLRPEGFLLGPDTAIAAGRPGRNVGNNSAGAPVCSLWQDDRSCSGNDVVTEQRRGGTVNPAQPQELAVRMKGDRLENQLYREVQALAQQHRQEVERRYPKVMRRVSGLQLG